MKNTGSPQSPSRLAFLFAAVAYAAITGLNLLSSRMTLRYDQLFGAVVRMMWSSTAPMAGPFILPLVLADGAIPLLGFLVCLVGVVVPSYRLPLADRRFMQFCYRYAVALPLYLLLASQLSRYVANLVYVLAPHIRWNLTPLIEQVEGGFLAGLQTHLYSPLLSQICSLIYSVIWFVPMAAVVPVLVCMVFMDEPTVINQMIAGFFLLSIFAIPFFVLLPVFEPWTVNPIYGNPGPLPLNLLCLYPHADIGALTQINRDLKRAMACCLPSLHVSFPLMVHWITRRNRFSFVSWLFLVISGLNAFAILYLGRHWIVDIILAVPYTYMVVRLVEWLNLNFVLPLAPATAVATSPCPSDGIPITNEQLVDGRAGSGVLR